MLACLLFAFAEAIQAVCKAFHFRLSVLSSAIDPVHPLYPDRGTACRICRKSRCSQSNWGALHQRTQMKPPWWNFFLSFCIFLIFHKLQWSVSGHRHLPAWNKIFNFDRMEQFGMTGDFVRDKVDSQTRPKDPEQTHQTFACLPGKTWKIISGWFRRDRLSFSLQPKSGWTRLAILQPLSMINLGFGNLSSWRLLGCSGFVYGLSVIQSFMEAHGMKNGLFFSWSTPKSLILTTRKLRRFLVTELQWLGSELNHVFRQDILFGSMGRNMRESRFEIMESLKWTEERSSLFCKSCSKEHPGNAREKQLEIEHIDLFLLHRSLHIVNSIADALGVSREKCPFHSGEYGNTVSSSIPMLPREFDNPTMKTAVFPVLESDFHGPAPLLSVMNLLLRSPGTAIVLAPVISILTGRKPRSAWCGVANDFKYSQWLTRKPQDRTRVTLLLK